MSREVAVLNQALGRVGGNMLLEISDNTVEGRLARAFYDPIRKVVLSEFPWTFAIKRFVLLPLSGERPENEYVNAFRIPSHVMNILTVNDAPDDRTINTVDWQREGNNIIANVDKIYVKAVVDSVDLDYYSPLFIQAFAVRLASEFAIPLTSSVPMHKAFMQEYAAVISEAAMRDGQQGRTEVIRSKEYIHARLF